MYPTFATRTDNSAPSPHRRLDDWLLGSTEVGLAIGSAPRIGDRIDAALVGY